MSLADRVAAPDRSRPSSRAAARVGAASGRRRPGCSAPPPESRSQRRIATATGVGPNTAADASQPRISNSSRSSPARRAYVAAHCHASSARPVAHSSQSMKARSRHARHRPRSSSDCSKWPSASSATRRACSWPPLVPACRRIELLVDAGRATRAAVSPVARSSFDRLRRGLDRRPSRRPVSSSATPERRQQLDASGILGTEQRDGAFEQPGSGGGVAARECRARLRSRAGPPPPRRARGRASVAAPISARWR